MIPDDVSPRYYDLEFGDAPEVTKRQKMDIEDAVFEGNIVIKREQLFNGKLVDPYEDRSTDTR